MCHCRSLLKGSFRLVRRVLVRHYNLSVSPGRLGTIVRGGHFRTVARKHGPKSRSVFSRRHGNVRKS